MAELYAAAPVWCAVRSCSEVSAPEAVIDDACQFAWIRLLHHRHRVGRERAVSWLITTALHEAFKLVRRDGHDLSLEELLEESGDLRINRTAARARARPWARAYGSSSSASCPSARSASSGFRGSASAIQRWPTEADMTVRTVERQLMKARRSMRLLEAGGGAEAVRDGARALRASARLAALAPLALGRAELARLGRGLGARLGAR